MSKGRDQEDVAETNVSDTRRRGKASPSRLETEGTVGSCGSELKLMNDEKIHKRLNPHPLAFYNLYFIWIYVVILTIIFMIYGDKISSTVGNPLVYPIEAARSVTNTLSKSFISRLPVVSDVISDINSIATEAAFLYKKYSAVSLWIFALLISSIAISVLRISWKWIFILLGIGILSFSLTLYLKLRPTGVYYIAIILAIFGVIGVEIYRRHHTFYITNFRIITELGFIEYKLNSLEYDKINNLILEQSLIGRIFNFGTLIPITASGLGMGEDAASVILGIGGKPQKGPFIGGAVMGTRGIQIPRARSAYALYGISNPREIYNLLSEFIHENVEAPYLKEISKDIKERKDKKSG